jgi:hypothetical protein
MSERPRQTEAELVEFLRSVDVRAAGELHDRIETLVDERSPRGSRRTLRSRASGPRPLLGWQLRGGMAVPIAAVDPGTSVADSGVMR